MTTLVINWIAIIVCFVCAAINLFGFIKSNRTFNKWSDRSKKLQELVESQEALDKQWQDTRRKWINKRRGRVHQLRDAKLAMQYLDELNELEKILETMSSKN